MKVRNFEEKVNGIVETKSRLDAAILQTEWDISAKKAAIVSESKRHAEAALGAILSGDPVPEASGVALVEMQAGLMILEARLSGLTAKRAEISDSFQTVKGEIEDARRVWEKDLISEQLRKVIPDVITFATAMQETIALAKAVKQFSPTGPLWVAVHTAVAGLQEIARSESVPFPEGLDLPVEPEPLADEGTVKALASLDQVAKRIDKEIRADRQPAPRKLEAVA
jgi:hypothetical protein